MARRKKILVLFDLAEHPPADQDFSVEFDSDFWETEGDVVDTLRFLGYKVLPVGIFDDFQPLLKAVDEFQPHIIFNLAESFHNDRGQEPNLAAFLELLGIPYTGARPTTLALCKNKGLSKKILAYHRIHIPKFVMSHRNRPIRHLRNLEFPVIVKPVGLEASDGISKDSLVESVDDCFRRIEFVHERLKMDAIVEEYIVGRELYVGLIGQTRPKVFPPRELFFRKVPKGTPKFATYQAKWNESYRKRWGIESGPAAKIDADVLHRIHQTCRRVYRVLQIDGYARLDLRLKKNGEVYVLEINPNPTLAEYEDFSLSAAAGGMTFEKVIEKIVSMAH